MKGGSKTVFIWLVLGIIVIAIFAVFIAQRKTTTEKTIFTNIVEQFFPSKMEITVQGATASTGCPVIELDGAEMLAQAVIDCWKKGEMANQGKFILTGADVQCCYNIDPKKLTGQIYITDLKRELSMKPAGKDLVSRVRWQVGMERVAVTNKTPDFLICYDYNRARRDQIHLTFNPQDCS